MLARKTIHDGAPGTAFRVPSPKAACTLGIGATSAPMPDARRERGNELFKRGEVAAAAEAYEEALADATLSDAERLPVASNLGFCHLKLGARERARAVLDGALALELQCARQPELAAKAAARLAQVLVDLDDGVACRAAVAYGRYCCARAGISPSKLRLPPPPARAQERAVALLTRMHAEQLVRDEREWPSEFKDLLLSAGVLPPAAASEPLTHELSSCAETADPNGLTAIFAAAGFRHPALSEARSCAWGEHVLGVMLRAGAPVDARDADGRTALMAAASCQRARMCRSLLEARASVHARDAELWTPLLCACNLEAEETKVGVVEVLLAAGSEIDARTALGGTALGLRLLALPPRGANAAAARLLLRARAEWRAHRMGGSALQLVLRAHGADSPAMRALCDASARPPTDDERTEAERFSALVAFVDDKITTAVNAVFVEHAGTGRSAWEGGLAQERRACEAVLRHFGVEDVPSAADAESAAATSALPPLERNPLAEVWRALDATAPRLVRAWWAAEAELGDADAGLCSSLSGAMASRGARLLAPSPNGLGFVCPIQRVLQQGVLSPVQHAFASAVPSDEALGAIAQLGVPVVELGAGTGYWGALLAARGVDVVLYDREPPSARAGNNNFFHRAFARVRRGDERAAAAHPERALLLVWPFSLEEMSKDLREGRAFAPWDKAALDAYKGELVLHVGSITEPEPGAERGPGRARSRWTVTTSPAFCAALRAEFECERVAPVHQWPQTNDELTIWRRRHATAAAVSAGS